MSKLIVMTDLHLCHDGRRIIGLDPAEKLQAALAHALKYQGDADALILTGDLAHLGHPDAYVQLADILADCPLPIYPMLGNHDHRENFKTVFHKAATDPNGFVQSFQDFGNMRAIFLDTLDGETKGDLYHSGILCPARMAWLRGVLDQSSERQVLIFMHHPPFETGFAGMDAIRLRNGDAFLDLLGAYPNVAHVIAGHIHRTISGTVRGISYSMFKSTCHQMPLVFDVNDSSLSVSEPAAYGVILTHSDGITVHSEDFEIAQQARTSQPDALGE